MVASRQLTVLLFVCFGLAFLHSYAIILHGQNTMYPCHANMYFLWIVIGVIPFLSLFLRLKFIQDFCRKYAYSTFIQHENWSSRLNYWTINNVDPLFSFVYFFDYYAQILLVVYQRVSKNTIYRSKRIL